ncbi:uncharacterized protein LOC111247948 isoform X4 [Varroa destructor]|uniref:PSP proline-rich domain-containing protein n=1 Tax=Varroa destructor TaxID=109461 RepID=A0A7M7JS08_VARDE|nr:uncharacterized protein LOC111247948 isoform X4 [Varroa destructor]
MELPLISYWLPSGSAFSTKITGLWIRSDHNRDDTPHLLDVWLEKNARFYHSASVDIRMLPQEYEDNPTKHNWPVSRYKTLIRHKEDALSYAREQKIPFVWFLDTDAFITNENLLQDLMAENRTVIAPLLQSMSLYSNFWGEMDKLGCATARTCKTNNLMNFKDKYYVRSKNYMKIVERELIGIHPAALVHSAVLVDLRGRNSDWLTFRREILDPAQEKSLPLDDIIVFARSAQKAKIDQFITNRKIHGWMLASTGTVSMEQQELVNLKVDVTHKDQPLPESDVLRRLTRKPVKDSLGVDQVYLINLQRRRDRHDRMKYCFTELGVRYNYMPAVDGMKISAKMKESLGIRQLPEYRDPYRDRNLTLGEVGCFLSHYNIWQDILKQGYREAIIFEDDIHFVPYFRKRVMETVKAIRDQGHLELVYLGRKRLANASEPYLTGTDQLVQVDYSYWTLSYYINRRGAQKLIDGEPLSKIVPVDEYIPIMFDRKYFGHVKHHLEQLIRENNSDLSQLFYVDTAKTEAAPPHKQIYDSVKNSSLLDQNDSAVTPSGGNPGSRSCFNCLGDHHMSECTQPIDRRAIAENRRKLQPKQPCSNTRFFEDEERASRFTPGRWGRRLLEAIGVRRNELPPFVYRMRVLGYPPGWLQEAEVETSGLKIFDGHGNEVKKTRPIKTRKEKAAAEDGEVLSAGSDDLDSDEDDDNELRYDPTKLIEVPGFNMPLPSNCVDDHRRQGMPPLQPHQMKENALQSMKAKQEPQKKFMRRMNLLPPKNTASKLDSETGGSDEKSLLKRKLNLPLPKNETSGTASNGAGEGKAASETDKTDEAPATKKICKSIESDGIDEAGQTRDSQERPTEGADDNKEAKRDNNAMDDPTSSKSCVKLHRSLSLGSVPGTPIPASISRVVSLPDPQKWSIGVADHIPFENLPGATGTFEKMRGLLAKIKDLRNGDS